MNGSDIALVKGVWEIPGSASGDFELKLFK
jgi:hypothetical protein